MNNYKDFEETRRTYYLAMALLKDCINDLDTWSVWNDDLITDEVNDLRSNVEIIEAKFEQAEKEAK